MNDDQHTEQMSASNGSGARRRRADAAQNFSRIIEAAVELLEHDTSATVDQIADAAGLDD